MSSTNNLLASLLQVQPDTDEPLRAPGRPKKWTEERYLALLDDFTDMRLKFIIQHGRKPVSDIELLTVMVANMLRERGLRESRTTDPEIQKHLKSLRNRLSEARKLI